MNFKLGLCQMAGTLDKEETRAIAEKFVREAAENGAQVVALPEMWDCPYSNDYFRDYAEPADGPTVEFMSKLAADLGVYLIGGSISELDGDKVYNTSFSFNRQGDLIGRHRKVHLFDIDVEGGIRFMESDTLTAGEDMTILDTEFCKIGVAICYDVRFPEWHRKMALAGAKLIVLPAAFNMTTGPAHWDLTMRARALDNQVYFAANAPARDENGVYVAYGNSCIASPWGDFIAHADEKEQIIYGDIDLDRVDAVREQLPQIAFIGIGFYGNIIKKNAVGNAIAVLSLNVPLTAWWETSHKIRQHNIAIEEAGIMQDNLGKMMSLEEEKAYSDMLDAYMLMKSDSSALEVAKENYRLSNLNYAAGNTTLSEVLQAHALLLQAQNAITDRRTTYTVARRRLLDLKGNNEHKR